MRRAGEQVCAIIVEPMIQGAAGMLDYNASFLRAARELADAYGALLIFDEVATGFGRTGRCGPPSTPASSPTSSPAARASPAGTCRCRPCSPPSTSTRPSSARGPTPRTFFHGHTYTANPLCCAAALANLRVMGEQDVIGQAARSANGSRSSWNRWAPRTASSRSASWAR